jgi:FkbM family methyltransferase
MIRTLKVLIVLVILGTVGYFYPPPRLFVLKLIGRASVCPLKQAMHSYDQISGTTAAKDRLLRESRLVEKDPAGFHLWQTPKGRFWMPAGSDFAVFFDLGEQQMNIYGQDGFGVRAGDVVLDCGANVGVYTRTALDAGARLVVAIELAPDNLECLRRNFADEIRAGRVIVYPKGVWNKDDFLTLTVTPNNSAAYSVVLTPEKGHEGPTVPLTTIDKLVAELRLDRVDYIKMDIEGAEKQALVGARATLAKYHPRMALSAYHLPGDPVKIPEVVRQCWAGYHTVCGPCLDGGSSIITAVLYFY